MQQLKRVREIIAEWRKGCSVTIEGAIGGVPLHPSDCTECSRTALEAIEKVVAFKRDRGKGRITWAMQQRQEFIMKHVTEHGTINRADIMAAFQTSLQLSTSDIRRFMADNPGLLKYSHRKLRYELRRAGVDDLQEE